MDGGGLLKKERKKEKKEKLCNKKKKKKNSSTVVKQLLSNEVRLSQLVFPEVFIDCFLLSSDGPGTWKGFS